MTLGLRHVALLIAFVLPLSRLLANENEAVKCSVNQERVWVYDSLTTFNVAAKLKCGETVALRGRENGFVKVRTANGTEGYVLEENLPKAVPVQAPAATPNPPSQPPVGSAARRATAAPTPASRSTAEANAANAEPPVTASRTSSTAEPKATSANASATATAEASAATRGSKNVASPADAATKPVRAHAATASSHAKSRKKAKTSSTATSTTAGKSTTKTPVTASARPEGGATAHAPAPPSTPAGQLKVSSPAVHAREDDLANAPATTPTAKPAAVRNASDDSSDEEGDDNSYLIRPKSESEDPACRFYFSGYGLSPGQFKWVVDNRKKRFPAVCPAATPGMVDYVIIFTHDVEFFNYTMPTPVHTEAGGFSDWNPLVLFDMNGVPRSEIDKSKHEYVWVFHVKRGTYDPAKFSPHRRFQFTKIESRYSRTVEDAFEYIETQSVNR